MEDRLVESKELLVQLAFAQLRALLVHSEVYDRRNAIHDVKGVFETDLHVVSCGFSLHPLHVINCIGTLQIEAIVILLIFVSV
jgi:hypothetical protein